MKKPHKHKPSRPEHKPGRPAAHGVRPAHGEAAPLVGHSTRRQSAPARVDSRRAQAARRVSPPTLYRRPNPLHIQSRDDRQTLRLLLLPFVVMALALAILPSLHIFPTLHDLIAQTPLQTAPLVTDVTELSSQQAPRPIASAPQALTAAAQPDTPSLELSDGERSVVAPRSDVPQIPTAYAALDTAAPTVPTLEAARSAGVASLSWADPAIPSAMQNVAPAVSAAAPALRLTDVRSTTTPALPARPAQMAITVLSAAQLPELAGLAPSYPALLVPLPPSPYELSCPVTYASAAPTEDEPDSAVSSAPFGERLATAAAGQTKHFVIYDDKYRQISRAGGDVPALYGVCTDVIVRAYRSLGIDLQTLVQASRLGAGDPNIDHRRTETLRRFLARYGQTLPVTPFGEDYRPGDIVTYWRPQNSGSRSHIAVVAATRGPSGNPMIIHNRGWGPQVEDGLFVDRITGHYRYDGAARPSVPPELASTKAKPFPLAPAATRAAAQSTGSLPVAGQNGL